MDIHLIYYGYPKQGGEDIARTGRPPAGDATRDQQYRLRMSGEELERLEYCCKVLGLTKAEVIRRGIDTVYEEAQNKNE